VSRLLTAAFIGSWSLFCYAKQRRLQSIGSASASPPPPVLYIVRGPVSDWFRATVGRHAAANWSRMCGSWTQPLADSNPPHFEYCREAIVVIQSAVAAWFDWSA